MRYVYDEELEEFIILKGNAVVGFADTEEEAKRMVERGVSE